MNLKTHYQNLPRRTGLTPKQEFIMKVSEECGVTPETVYRWISGANKPDKLKQEQLSKITGIPVEDLFNF